MDDHTIFPSPIGLAATFDTDLLKAYGRVVASEARSAGLHVCWAPVLGLCREPRWGRCEEMMGEDPHLAGVLGQHVILGLTNDGNLSSPTASNNYTSGTMTKSGCGSPARAYSYGTHAPMGCTVRADEQTKANGPPLTNR